MTLLLKDGSGQPASSFPAGQPITFELTVTNLTKVPQALSFTTGQHNDFLVPNQTEEQGPLAVVDERGGVYPGLHQA